MKNSTHFVQRIAQTSLGESDIMVSFDVVSLFTRVPVDEALQVITELLRQDDTLMDRTAIPAPDLCHLIELCLKSMYFRFGDLFYEQAEGAAMGSPLSPVVANLYKEAFEKQTLEAALRRPTFWVRYVDDVFSIWPHDTQSLDEFLGHLNSQKPTIQFTMEKEEDGKIAFLDVLVQKKGTLATTSIFRKKTHTDRYRNYDSHHHARIKSSIIKLMPGDQSQECLPCHQTDWRTEPPEASLPSKWVPSTDGEPAPQEPPPRPPLFHPNRGAGADHPQVSLLTVCERCQREDREEVQAPGYQDNLQIEGNPQRGLGANKRPPNQSGRRKESCTRYHVPNARVSKSDKQEEHWRRG